MWTIVREGSSPSLGTFIKKIMFGIFKKKSEKEKLQETYAKLMTDAYKMSHTNRTESDKIMAQAEEIAKKIDLLK